MGFCANDKHLLIYETVIRLDYDQTNNILIKNLKIFINSEYVFFFSSEAWLLLRTSIVKQQYK